MARRSSSLPLYEAIMRARPQARRVEAAVDEPPPPPVADPVEPPRLLASRIIRLPVGYVLLGVFAVLVIVTVAYVLGSWRGAAVERARLDQEFLAASAAWRANDPLNDPRDDPRRAPAADGEPSPLARVEPVVAPPEGRAGDGRAVGAAEVDEGAREAAVGREDPRDPAWWGPLESDPRDPALFYLVLAQPPPEGARRLARFCRDYGLEAYVVDGHNARSRRVIAGSGFASGSMSDPEVRTLLQEIMQIGVAWRSRYPGESDFSDAYLSR